jgi:segregation and condensation protein A
MTPSTPDGTPRPRRSLGHGAAAPEPAGPAAPPGLSPPFGTATSPAQPPETERPVAEPAAALLPAAGAPEGELPGGVLRGRLSRAGLSRGVVPQAAPEGGLPEAEAAAAGLPPVGAAGATAVPGARDSAGAGSADETGAGGNRFTVRLVNFEGPFDLLLQLISRHKLDVTEVALSKVTNEFMAYIRAMGPDWDLDQTTEFLVVAATLLDLKAARLLPTAEVEDEGDLALLEARDLLFARLLQYRAYKQIAAIFAERLEGEALRCPRTVGLEPQHAELLPEVVLSIGPERFARLAVKAMQPRPKPQVYVDHIHAPLVSVREQGEHVIALLRELGTASFQQLTADAADTLTVVARFLALLELYREKAVVLDQEEALGRLQVRWTGGAGDTAAPLVTDEFDQEAVPAPGPAGPGARNPDRAAGGGTMNPGTNGEQR